MEGWENGSLNNKEFQLSQRLSMSHCILSALIVSGLADLASYWQHLNFITGEFFSECQCPFCLFLLAVQNWWDYKAPGGSPQVSIGRNLYMKYPRFLRVLLLVFHDQQCALELSPLPAVETGISTYWSFHFLSLLLSYPNIYVDHFLH